MARKIAPSEARGVKASLDNSPAFTRKTDADHKRAERNPFALIAGMPVARNASLKRDPRVKDRTYPVYVRYDNG